MRSYLMLSLSLFALPGCQGGCPELGALCECVEAQTADLTVNLTEDLLYAHADTCSGYWQGSVDPRIQARCIVDYSDLRDAVDASALTCE